MRKYYIAYELNRVLTEQDYYSLIERFSESQGMEIEELIKSDKDYKLLEINLNIGDEMSLLKLDNYLSDCTGYNGFTGLDISDPIEFEFISYRLVDGWWLNIEFDVIEIDKDDELDSIIKITNIELK